MRVPLGVFGMVYESRPNVTIEAASLALKSGNAAILRGGSEALQSNLALAREVQAALAEAGLPPEAVQLVETSDRAAVGRLIAMPEFCGPDHPARRQGPDRAHQPRGQGAGDQAPGWQLPPSMSMPRSIWTSRSKSPTTPRRQKFSPCNAAESLLVHVAQAAAFLPRIGDVFAAKGVEMRCCPRALALLAGRPKLVAATDADWGEEYLAPIISIKVVDSLDEAMDHIQRHGSHHTDAILSSNHAHAMRFIREVDSARRDGQRQHALCRRLRVRAWGPRSASRPTSCMRAGRWAWKA